VATRRSIEPQRFRDLMSGVVAIVTAACSAMIRGIWRDSAAGPRHAVILPAVSYEIYGKALLGRTDQMTPLI
jgi:hypothetical protein